MSELKRFDIVGKYADEEVMYEFRPDGECYDAEEVDKLIAELNMRICEGDEDFEIANDQIKRLLKLVRHQKYKRCLAMAELCRTSALYEKSLDALEYFKWWLKWYERWMKLAEQFKDEK